MTARVKKKLAKKRPVRPAPQVQKLSGVQADAALVQRCLAGQAAAWSTLYQQCHDRLLGAIRRILRSAADESAVDEVAARVWFAVVKDEGAVLRRFDPARGCRLITFLAAVARFEVRVYLRSERRLRDRQSEASHLLPREQPAETFSPADFQERFLSRLTHREREFLDQELLGEQSAAGTSFSVANSWQLRHRVHEKLAAFFRE